MNKYEIVTNRGMINHVESDWFDYTQDHQALFHLEVDPPELVASFDNPSSVVKIKGASDE
jgi:hypothetical protein